jgi:hypothetical protein
MAIYKNTSKRIAFGSLTTAGAANTATTPTVTVSLDGAAPATATNTPTHLGNGQWTLVLTAAEMNADLVAVTATGTGLVPAYREFYTEADWTSTRAANLDAAVSTRSTYAGTDTAGTTTLLARLTAGRATALDNLDATVSSRSTYAGADTAGTTTLLARLTAGRAANLDNLDAAVSTRSTYAGGDTAGTTTLLSRITGAIAPQTGDTFARLGAAGAGLTALGDARLANLDAAVSTRSTYAGTDTPGTGTLLARLTAGRATALDNLDATITSRMATFTYLPPDNTTLGYLANLLTGDHSAFTAIALANAPTGGGGGGLDQAGVQAALDAQGYTAARAAYLDVAVSSRLAAIDYTAPTAFPADYQQRGVAVTLPAAPAGYGGAPADVIVSALLTSAVTCRDVTAVTSPTVMDAFAAAFVEAAGAESVLNRAYVKLTPTGGVFRTFTLTTAPGDQARS